MLLPTRTLSAFKYRLAKSANGKKRVTNHHIWQSHHQHLPSLSLTAAICEDQDSQFPLRKDEPQTHFNQFLCDYTPIAWYRRCLTRHNMYAPLCLVEYTHRTPLYFCFVFVGSVTCPVIHRQKSLQNRRLRWGLGSCTLPGKTGNTN